MVADKPRLALLQCLDMTVSTSILKELQWKPAKPRDEDEMALLMVLQSISCCFVILVTVGPEMLNVAPR